MSLNDTVKILQGLLRRLEIGGMLTYGGCETRIIGD
jgi:hypothetical protein